MNASRVFAIVPAAGQSRRMGEPKLLLPWSGRTIMDAVLKAWCDSDVTHTIVVLRKDDRDLVDACQAWPVEIVRPIVDPRDMKESIQFGLRHLSESHAPTSQDRWMVAPADVPTLTAEVINRLLVASETTTGVIAARFGGRQGHPVSLPCRCPRTCSNWTTMRDSTDSWRSKK